MKTHKMKILNLMYLHFILFYFIFFFFLRCQYIHVIIIIIIKSKFPLKENSLSCYWKNCTTRAFSVWNKNYYNFITPEHTSYSFPIINLSNKRVPSHTGKFLHVPSVWDLLWRPDILDPQIHPVYKTPQPPHQ